jgi:hypothetical protein
MAKLADKVANDVNNKIKNDSAAKAALSQAAKIADFQKSAGGPEAMLDSVTNMVSGLTGGGNSKSDTEIENTIRTTINNRTVNQNDISNIVKNRIETSMKQAASATCNMDTTGQNAIDVDKITALAMAGKSADVTLKQSVSIKAFNKCFIDLKMGQGIINDIGIDKSFTAKSETSNTNKTDSESKQEVAISTTKIQESAIMNSVDNAVNKVTGMISGIFQISPMLMIIIVVGGITAAVAAYFYSKSGSSESSDSSDQDGGFLEHFILSNTDSISSLRGMQTELHGGSDFFGVILVSLVSLFTTRIGIILLVFIIAVIATAIAVTKSKKN